MELYMEKDGKRLRLGYTTGSCAAAAAKAGAWMLLTGKRKETITLDNPADIGRPGNNHDEKCGFLRYRKRRWR